MLTLVFVTQLNHVPFTCFNEEKIYETIKMFEEARNRITKEKDEILWSVDEKGRSVAMVLCSQVIGYYIRKESDLQKKQINLMEKFYKLFNKGDEWKE